MVGSQIPGVTIREIKPFQDARGTLVKVLMLQHLPGPNRTFGEIYLNTAVPGAVKGNHYHVQATEWFYVIQGQMTLQLCDTLSGLRDQINLDGDTPMVVCIPPYVAHGLKNTGPAPAIFLAYADYPYDPNSPNTHFFEVLHK
jgi:dTDP-4-dehydrorhamnose 3,5-epimerase-like enzyme